jgi:DNA-binding response OmpR family regulator
VLLDLTLPGISGKDTLAALSKPGGPRVVVLTGVDSADALVECLNMGAFDIALKPFDPDDLEYCVKLALGDEVERESSQAPVHAGPVTLDFQACRLDNRFGRAPQLSLSEWRLLEVLAAHAGQAVLYQELLGRVWGPSFRSHLPFLDAWMARLQKKVGLSEFHGVGYALVV